MTPLQVPNILMIIFLTLTFPVKTPSINFAQLIVNLENDNMELDFLSKFI